MCTNSYQRVRSTRFLTLSGHLPGLHNRPSVDMDKGRGGVSLNSQPVNPMLILSPQLSRVLTQLQIKGVRLFT